jgi:hypothetical protein
MDCEDLRRSGNSDLHYRIACTTRGPRSLFALGRQPSQKPRKVSPEGDSPPISARTHPAILAGVPSGVTHTGVLG